MGAGIDPCYGEKLGAPRRNGRCRAGFVSVLGVRCPRKSSCRITGEDRRRVAGAVGCQVLPSPGGMGEGVHAAVEGGYSLASEETAWKRHRDLPVVVVAPCSCRAAPHRAPCHDGCWSNRPPPRHLPNPFPPPLSPGHLQTVFLGGGGRSSCGLHLQHTVHRCTVV